MRIIIACFVFVIFLTGQLIAQRMIELPEYEFRNTGLYKIGNIELTQQSTRVKLICEFVPGWWNLFTQDNTYIENSENGEKYYPVAIEGAEWNVKKITPASGVDTICIIFPPLPAEVKKVNWISDDTGIFCIRLDGISENQKEKECSGIEGNWWTTDGTNSWTYGIYPQFIIADNRFWNYEIVKETAGRMILNLTSGDQSRQLWITPQKNGNCKIGNSKKQQILYANHKGNLSPAEMDKSQPRNFFQPGSKALVQGYIQGYDSRAGFTSGLIYNENSVTDETVPVVVNIDSSGRFEVTLSLDYPVENSVFFENTSQNFSQNFYVEPGDTLTIFIEWEDWLQEDRYRDRNFYDYRTLCYMGPTAKINTDLNIFRKLILFDKVKLLKKQVKKYSPQQFKDLQFGLTQGRLSLLDSISKEYYFAPEAIRLAQDNIYCKMGSLFFDFIDYRKSALSAGDKTPILQTAVPDDYYNFMQQLPINDERVLANAGVRALIRDFKYSAPFKIGGLSFRSALEYYKKEQDMLDDVYTRFFNPAPSFIYDICKIHNLKYPLKRADRENTNEILSLVLADIKHPYLRQKVQDMANTKLASLDIKSNPLPEGKATEIFRQIIDKYQGKVIYVDFWSIFCGPCRAGIQRMASVREKYRGKDIVFLFITDEISSPLKLYEEFMVNVEGEKYRIPKTDYDHLCELFRFNSIPHYEIVDKKGEIVNRDFYPGKTDQGIFDILLKEE